MMIDMPTATSTIQNIGSWSKAYLPEFLNFIWPILGVILGVFAILFLFRGIIWAVGFLFMQFSHKNRLLNGVEDVMIGLDELRHSGGIKGFLSDTKVHPIASWFEGRRTWSATKNLFDNWKNDKI